MDGDANIEFQHFKYVCPGCDNTHDGIRMTQGAHKIELPVESMVDLGMTLIAMQQAMVTSGELEPSTVAYCMDEAEHLAEHGMRVAKAHIAAEEVIANASTIADL